MGKINISLPQIFFAVIVSFIMISTSVFSAQSDNFILTEDTFSSVQNSASTDSIISESILLPIQRVGESSGDIIERAHEISSCGNNLQEFQEVCDGNDFAGKSCSDFGFSSGLLICNQSCSAISSASCEQAGNTPIATPISTPAPQVVSSGSTPLPNSGVVNSGGGSTGTGGIDPLLLVTPAPETPSEENIHASAEVISPSVGINEVNTIDPSNFYTDEYDPSPSTGNNHQGTLGTIEEGAESLGENESNTEYDIQDNTIEYNNINKDEIEGFVYEDMYTGSILIPEDSFTVESGNTKERNIQETNYNKQEDYNGVRNGGVNSIIQTQENERFHYSGEYNNENEDVSPGLYRLCNSSSYSLYILLLLIFLLGMLAEYIISSVLLTHKK